MARAQEQSQTNQRSTGYVPFILNKKRALLITAATSLALVAVALAWYTTTGDGSGSGGTTANGYANNLVITGDATNAGALVPGGSVPISNGKIHNGNPGSAKHGAISATVDAAAGGCSDSYFHVTGITLDGSSDVIPAGGDRLFTATLSMDDAPAADQDACKNTGLTIDWNG